MATTVQQANAPAHAAESFPAKAVYWLIAFAVIIGLGIAFSMMRERWISTPAGDTYSVPAEVAPPTSDRTTAPTRAE